MDDRHREMGWPSLDRSFLGMINYNSGGHDR